MFSVGSAMRVQNEKEKLMQTIDLQCHGFTIEIEQTDWSNDDVWINTLLCNGNFVFSDPDITKLYIVLGKHLLTVWQNKDFLTK